MLMPLVITIIKHLVNITICIQVYEFVKLQFLSLKKEKLTASFLHIMEVVIHDKCKEIFRRKSKNLLYNYKNVIIFPVTPLHTVGISHTLCFFFVLCFIKFQQKVPDYNRKLLLKYFC